MKKRNIIILVLFLVIGFASVSTTLFINGTLNLGFNQSKFDTDVIYTRAETPYGDATIEEGSKDITFNTEKLENVNQESVLEFDVTNKSRDYDASVTINCGLTEEFESYNEYVTITTDLTSPFELNSSETKTGTVTVKMIKAFNEALEKELEFTCKLVATPVERDTLGDEYVTLYKDKILQGTDPVLKEGLIPVTISSDGTVTCADINKEWYNYANKEWANAVILVDEPSKEYKIGNIIKEEDIESYFVWVPRYKYLIFGDYPNKIDSDPTGKGLEQEIQIEFESKEVAPSIGTKVGEWLTHPAFTNFDVNGLWVAKFETGYEGAKLPEDSEVNIDDSSKVVIKPNVYSWRNNTVGNMFKTAYNYNRELDSHMMKNTEWGAVAYLSHSKYGINTEVNVNNNSNFVTGYSAVEGTDQSGIKGVSGTTPDVTLPYNTETGYKASTTGNITGIYDLSGGAYEYVAAYMNGYGVQNGATTPILSGLSQEELITYSKYLEVYPNDNTVSSFENRILGDATGEMGPFYIYKDKDGNTHYHSSWYGDSAFFIDYVYPWLTRGGFYGNGIYAGQFFFCREPGKNDHYGTSRIILAI